MGWSPRAVPALLVAAAVGCWPLVPPAHIHEADDRHPQTIAHRHVEPHRPNHQDSAAELSDADGRVVWLDDAAVLPTTNALPVPVDALAIQADAIPAVQHFVPTPFDDAAPPHGPPRAPFLLRGPPSLPR